MHVFVGVFFLSLSCYSVFPEMILNRWCFEQMIVEPEQRVPDFIKAGADIVSVHCENASTIHLHRTINQVSLFSNTQFASSMM